MKRNISPTRQRGVCSSVRWRFGLVSFLPRVLCPSTVMAWALQSRSRGPHAATQDDAEADVDVAADGRGIVAVGRSPAAWEVGPRAAAVDTVFFIFRAFRIF